MKRKQRMTVVRVLSRDASNWAREAGRCEVSNGRLLDLAIRRYRKRREAERQAIPAERLG